MKKRILVTLILVLATATIALVAAIFKLYIEAEKVQRSIFVSEVLSAGDDIVNKIDAVLKGDTLPSPPVADVKSDKDSSSVIFQKFAKKFLLDSASTKPVGVVKSTITYKGSNAIISEFDTIYFDATYKNGDRFLPTAWETDLDATVQFKETHKNPNKSNTRIIPGNYIEMDSNSRALLNREFLHRIIKESLVEQSITTDFDFALLNILTSEFVVPPAEYSEETVLKSEYVFTLKYNEKFSAPHYLILYFPGERGVFFQRMSVIAILIVVFLLIILIISGTTLVRLYRQKRITDVKNDFVNNITHEFKTPISTISLACEALSDENITDAGFRKTYISIIQDENNRLKKMVNDILQLAQLNKGQLAIKLERIDVHKIIQHVADAVSLQISSNDGTLRLLLDAENPIILADPSHIENVIINLIENAIKYSPTKPEIEIRTFSDKKHLTISIKDNGIGISKKDQKKIFNEFYRVSKGNIHDNKGYGLGLGYVKKIVFLHGGFITVESELKHGSTFTIHLPLKK